MKLPTTTQRTMWACFFPSACFLFFYFSHCKTHRSHSDVGKQYGFATQHPLSLVLPFTSSSFLLASIFLLLFTAFISCFFRLAFFITIAFYCNPSLFCLFSRLFFPCSFLSIIPPPTFSQVKRFLPCFSSNWRMRCMSWLRCCFIRKQLFTLPLPPPLLFSLSPPHYLTPFLPCILSSISHHAFLHTSPCLYCSHWCKLVNAR